jgi:para-aminobenzoate synthetase/4-amino-4-deoxychorismate lyase
LNSTCAANKHSGKPAERTTPPLAFFEDRLGNQLRDQQTTSTDGQADNANAQGWLFADYCGQLAAHDAATLPHAFAALEAARQAGQWAVLALDYELGYLLEPAAAPANWQHDPQRPLLRAWLFAQRHTVTGEAAITDTLARLSTTGADSGATGVSALLPALSEADYCAAIERIRAYIAAGDCYQVNYTFPLAFDWFGSPLALYRALRERQPVRYGGLVCHAGSATAQTHLLSFSPELFVEKQGERLTTRPMKGTAPRHPDPTTDAAHARSLHASEKNRAENLMIVDLLRNDLGRLAPPGGVQLEQLFGIEAYPSLFQMVSQISANVGTAGLADCLRALFPCGSITGAPKIRAMQIAAELEVAERGLYTGSLGWLGPDGDFRLNVAIRTLCLHEGTGGKTGTLGIGSGIVTDSVPAEEWAECLLKADFLRRMEPSFSAPATGVTTAGLQLIETLRLENGAYPELAGHLARLQRSSQTLGFACELAAIRAALLAYAQNLSVPACWRVRLTLNKAGEWAITSGALAPLQAAGAETPLFATLATSPIDAHHLLRRHKTTDRQLYDSALTALANTPEVFDQIFLNQYGEVAEGARSTVFLALPGGGPLLTPPVTSGALPGVLRARLLAEGKAVETVIRPEQLQQGQLYLGNALRGLVAVTLRTAM